MAIGEVKHIEANASDSSDDDSPQPRSRTRQAAAEENAEVENNVDPENNTHPETNANEEEQLEGNANPPMRRFANRVDVNMILDNIHQPGTITRSRARLANLCGHFCSRLALDVDAPPAPLASRLHCSRRTSLSSPLERPNRESKLAAGSNHKM